MNKKLNITLAISLIAVAVSLRLIPHAANFAPVTAVAIFGGAILPRRLSIWVPLVAMIASDYFLGFYNTILITWACYGLIALASSYAMKKPSLRRGLSLTIGASLFFFVVTNFATWVWSGMYDHSWAGLGQCYTMALPFFRNTALSDLVYTGALFGIYAFAFKASTRLQKTHLSKA
ncbi:MAG TPA: DUF6580 family putative transport protein [Candidatus Saccharimonadales bacterium]|nr:DUF6580 family putative transport protein [Candidatus Saccharimonadales bacterium]